MKIRIVIERPFGRIEVEGETLDEIIEHLKTVPEWLNIIDETLMAPELATPKSALTGLIEFTAEGPVLVAPKEKLTDKESLSLLLYASDPNPVEYKELGKLLSLSGRLSPGYPARLSELRGEGFVIREGDSYRLTVSGKKWIEELIRSLKG